MNSMYLSRSARTKIMNVGAELAGCLNVLSVRNNTDNRMSNTIDRFNQIGKFSKQEVLE